MREGQCLVGGERCDYDADAAALLQKRTGSQEEAVTELDV